MEINHIDELLHAPKLPGERWLTAFQFAISKQELNEQGYHRPTKPRKYRGKRGEAVILDERHAALFAVMLHMCPPDDLYGKQTKTLHSQAAIAAALGCSIKTVQRLMDDIEAAGKLRRKRRGGAGRNETNETHLFLEQLGPDDPWDTDARDELPFEDLTKKPKVQKKSADVVDPSDAEVEAVLDSLAVPVTGRQQDEQDLDILWAKLCADFSDHKDLADEAGKRILRACLRQAASKAKDWCPEGVPIYRCMQELYLYALKEDGSGKVVRLIRKSDNLGAYLIGCFPKWADKYGNTVLLAETEPEPPDDYDGSLEILAEWHCTNKGTPPETCEIYLDRATLINCRDTGALAGPMIDKGSRLALREIYINEGDGIHSFLTGEVDLDDRWTRLVDNPIGPDDACENCLDSGRVCTTVATKDEAYRLTIETDDYCHCSTGRELKVREGKPDKVLADFRWTVKGEIPSNVAVRIEYSENDTFWYRHLDSLLDDEQKLVLGSLQFHGRPETPQAYTISVDSRWERQEDPDCSCQYCFDDEMLQYRYVDRERNNLLLIEIPVFCTHCYVGRDIKYWDLQEREECRVATAPPNELPEHDIWRRLKHQDYSCGDIRCPGCRGKEMLEFCGEEIRSLDPEIVWHAECLDED
jgi:hypothetical protein